MNRIILFACFVIACNSGQDAKKIRLDLLLLFW